MPRLSPSAIASLAACAMFAAALPAAAQSQPAQPQAAGAPPQDAPAQQQPTLLQRMAGTWQVQQRMWPAPDAQAVELPPAVAQRNWIGNYLQEVMVPASLDAKAGLFRRDAMLVYNPVERRFECVSLDTRAPQLMVEIGAAGASPTNPGELRLQGGEFRAPEWGQAKNVVFRYRLSIGELREDRQTVRLYLTPKTVLPPKEFLAFEYVYHDPKR